MLGLEAVPVVHLRSITDADDTEVPFAEALGTMLEVRDEGKIEHIGLSNVDLVQIRPRSR